MLETFILLWLFLYPLHALLLSKESLHRIRYGGVAVEHEWLEADLIHALRDDAMDLFTKGYFTPDGLTNTALSKSQQGFSRSTDRQTFKGDGWFNASLGNAEARQTFADKMKGLRQQLAAELERPTLASDGERKHEMTYNWYEPRAKLGRHLDEHHEETKGVKGWVHPSRRSVTWLVYLNDEWKAEEGGSLKTFPRRELSTVEVGSHEGNLQIGWLHSNIPVFLDAWRPSGQTALYTVDSSSKERVYVSVADFDVPSQPIEFVHFLPKSKQKAFEQISTARLDPRFASGGSGPASIAPPQLQEGVEEHFMDVVPAAGTLVLFDSVSLPHLVREVTANRQRIAATGWFHEDSECLLTMS